MKKLLLLLLCLILLLSACDRVQVDTSEDVSALLETSQPPTDYYTDILVKNNVTFEVDSLKGKTSEQLIQEMGNGVSFYNNTYVMHLNTPTSLLFHQRRSSVPVAYDKESGKFTSACRDPLCDHSNCVWHGFLGDKLFYCYGEHLFYVERDTNIIMKSNCYGNDASVIYVGKEEPVYLTALDGYVYFEENSLDAKTNERIYRIKRVPIDGGKAETMVTVKSENDYMLYFLPVGDGKIIYWYDGNTYLTDGEQEFKYQEYFGAMAYCDGYVYYQTKDGWFVSPLGSELVEKVQLPEISYTPCFYGDRAYFTVRTKIEEKYYKSELYSCALDGTEQKLEWVFETDGVYDQVDLFSVSGSLLCEIYLTPEDLELNTPFTRYALIDMKTGERFDWTTIEIGNIQGE